MTGQEAWRLQWSNTPLCWKFVQAGKLTLDPQRTSLYDCDWQNRRVHMKGSWADASAFSKTKERLNAYLREGAIIDVGTEIVGEYATRLWRIVNLLDAVYMGWKEKELRTEHQLMFLDYKALIATEYHAHRDQLRTSQVMWAWKTTQSHDLVRRAWYHLSQDERKAILTDLSQRFKGTVKRARVRYKLQDPVKVAIEDRLELFWFIETVAPETASRLIDWANITS